MFVKKKNQKHWGKCITIFKVCHNIEMMMIIQFFDESFLVTKIKSLSIISRSIKKIAITRLIVEILAVRTNMMLCTNASCVADLSTYRNNRSCGSDRCFYMFMSSSIIWRNICLIALFSPENWIKLRKARSKTLNDKSQETGI